MADPTPVLKLIRSVESDGAVKAQGVRSAYDVVWSGIRKNNRPPKPLTQMTVREVWKWQESIDHLFMSEASGAYQIMQDTLATLVKGGDVSLDEVFNEATQDRLAVALMERRGWKGFTKGLLAPEDFGDQLAKEWASFPVHKDQQGRHRWLKRGQSYYAGDGLNKAGLKPEAVLAALEETKGGQWPPLTPAPAPDTALADRIKKLEYWQQNVIAWLKEMPK